MKRKSRFTQAKEEEEAAWLDSKSSVELENLRKSNNCHRCGADWSKFRWEDESDDEPPCYCEFEEES